jgi:uncharacterized membrane protein YiaA
MKKHFYKRRNTPAFTFMAWGAFSIASLFYFIGIWTLDQALSVQGYYAVCGVLIIICSFVLQKVVRDNEEDRYIREYDHTHRMRNTSAFTFMAWGGFCLAIMFEYIGLYNLQEPLYVKGYYAIGAAFLLVSCLVLQKTVRDNEEDKLAFGETEGDHSVTHL